MADIKLIRLVSGEDIISEARIANGTFYLKNPIIIVAMPGPAGQPPNIGFAPWLPYAKDRNLTVYEKDVVCFTEPLDQFVTQYKSITTNLALPNKSLILPGK